MKIDANPIYARLNELYRSNNDALTAVVDRLKAIANGDIPATGDIAGIRNAVSFRFTADQYQAIYGKLQDAKGATSLAVKTGEQAYDALSEMVRLAKLYSLLGVDQSDQKSSTDAAFQAQAGIVENLKTSAQYSGALVFRSGTVWQVTVDPSGGTVDITFDVTDIPDVRNFKLTGSDPAAVLDAVTAELQKIHSYMGKAFSYDSQVTGYLQMADAISNAANAGRTAITDTSASDLATATQIQVRQQTLSAILAQANLSQSVAAKLFEVKQP